MTSTTITNASKSVVDPGFPKGAPIPEGGGANLFLGIVFAENCMKMKKKDREGHASLDLPLQVMHCKTCTNKIQFYVVYK